LDGINDFVVEAPSKDQAFVVFDPDKLSIDQIKEAITEAGYDVEEIEETTKSPS
jgi:copper chaperone CopZ